MPIACAGFLTARSQLLQAKGADGLELGEARLAFALHAVDETVIDQSAETTHDVLRSAGSVTGDGLGGFEREPPIEDRQAPEERLLAGCK
jgi:hypothetical protein